MKTITNIIELHKTDHDIFKEVYEAEKGHKKVVVILDDNCVRYHKFKNGKLVGRKEYYDHEKEKCMKYALKYLEA